MKIHFPRNFFDVFCFVLEQNCGIWLRLLKKSLSYKNLKSLTEILFICTTDFCLY